MTLELMVSNLDLQARADRLAALDADALRKNALRAARDSDPEGLWALMEAQLVLHGGRGARVSQHTLHSYETGLRVFLDWAGPAGVSLLRPKPQDGFRYVRHLEAAGLSPSSVRTRLAAARSLYTALRWAGATEAAPFTDVRAAYDSVPRWEKRKPYSDDEIASMLAVAGPQEAVIVLLGAHCGLRNMEMLSLLRKDVRLDTDPPRITVTGKRQKRQEVELSRTATAALGAWLRATPNTGPHVLAIRTARGVEKAVRRLCLQAGVRYEGREVHGLRHSAGTKTYKVTQDILAVRDHLRHRSVDSSEIYVNYARGEKKKAHTDW